MLWLGKEIFSVVKLFKHCNVHNIGCILVVQSYERWLDKSKVSEIIENDINLSLFYLKLFPSLYKNHCPDKISKSVKNLNNQTLLDKRLVYVNVF